MSRRLDNNMLSGQLPPQIGNSMGVLSLENNQFTGDIPESWVDLTPPLTINVKGNQLSGCMPYFPDGVDTLPGSGFSFDGSDCSSPAPTNSTPTAAPSTLPTLFPSIDPTYSTAPTNEPTFSDATNPPSASPVEEAQPSSYKSDNQDAFLIFSGTFFLASFLVLIAGVVHSMYLKKRNRIEEAVEVHLNEENN